MGNMKHLKYSFQTLAAICALSSVLLTACSGVSEEKLVSRESAIALMESGDLEGAVTVFNDLVKEAKKVTEFELDILKYRGEAEFLLEDYEAALHTYRTLMEVDKERPEYCYMASIALAKDGQRHDAKLFLDSGKALDKDSQAPMFYQASVAYAESCMAAGEDMTATGIYQELIDGGFANTDLYNRLVMAAVNEGKYEEALELIKKGLTLTDTMAVQELKFNEAVCYEYLGEFSKALELFRYYIEEFGNDERAAHEITFLETR